MTGTNESRSPAAADIPHDAGDHPDIVVSVITPSFDSARFLGQTIESVQAQTFAKWEMIIVDDGSSDDSVDVAKRYAAADARIRPVALGRNVGAAVARNTAIEMARGRYIAFLDSDDLWKPDKLEKQIAFMRKHDCALSYGYYEKIDEAGVATGKVMRAPDRVTYRDMLAKCHIGCLTAVYDRGRLGRVTMPLIRKRQDWALWLKILKDAPYALGMREVLGAHRVRKGSISSNKIEMVKYHWMVFREIEKLNLISASYYLARNIYNKLRD